MAPSTTGSIALRDAEVQPPNTAATLSSVSSLLIFSAKTVGSLWPSSSMNSICLPMMPPAALISSAASMSESRTVCSLMAIAPDVEFRKPSLTVSPSTQVSPDAAASVPAGASVAPAASVPAGASGSLDVVSSSPPHALVNQGERCEQWHGGS